MTFAEIEAFQILDVGTDNGVKVLSDFTEDSIQQYSHARAQRADTVQKLLEQKEEDKAALENKENIQATISEDLADGYNANLDASLKLLRQDDLKLRLPSDVLEDDEIHIIETTNLKTASGENALQDYQMQLMLLEQQNKKRLLRARAELDRSVDWKFDRKASETEFERRKRRQATYREQMPTTRAGKPIPDLKAGHSKDKMPTSSAQEDRSSTRKKRKRETRSQLQLGRQNNSGSPDDKGSTRVDGEPPEAIPPYFELLYSISCSQHDSDEHPITVFRDMPVPQDKSDTQAVSSSSRDRGHLNGRIPVFDIEDSGENDTNDTAFTIIRTIECSQASVLMAQAGGLLRWTEDIHIKSHAARDALQQIATCYFHQLPKEEDPYSDPYPHPRRTSETSISQNQIVPADFFFFHHREALKKYVAEYADSKNHIDSLLQYIKYRFDPEFADADKFLAKGLVTQKHVLFLFKPNELVISGSYGKPAAFVLHQWPEMDDAGWVTLRCWSFQNDGSGFARKSSVISVPPIGSHASKIQDLVAYPLRFAAPELRETIRKRGEKHWQLRTAAQVTYRGWNVRRDQYFPDARFMIDHSIYLKMHENAKAFQFKKPERTFAYDRMPAYLTTEQEPSEICFLLMPPDIHGFYLNEKKWNQLFVDSVHPVVWNKKAYERLVLPRATKDLVRALVTVRTSQRGVKQGLGVAGKRVDITSGKGNGLIMLLHGGPGTGKTLTGESVAEIAEMPLYRVTCGDIGTSAGAVESYLNTVLYLGKTWNCVLLLDEADVFLEERSMADLQRNSLVSVFLRILEYYDGILILTSNRIGMFDEAFKSRIQVALHYKKLNSSARRQIWQNFLDMLEEDNEDVNFEEIRLRLEDLTERDLNGRQIRNVLTTARQLAMFRNERLDWEHLDQALSVSADFNKYIDGLQGHTDEQRAIDTGLR